MSEYCLQKRTLSHWSYVTWYEDLEQARLNFSRASKEGNGYSWRLVEVTVVSEKLLDGERDPQPETPEEAVQPAKSDWRGVSTFWPDKPTSGPNFKDAHGLTGSVWVGNPTTKEKKRVPAAEAVLMLASGTWIKSGPRTVL